MSIKAIETRYKGYRFRSRLEARWAVFFDALGIKYKYEEYGFEVDGPGGTKERWLPDFYLPHSATWVEVKGGRPSANDAMKMGYILDFGSPLPFFDDSENFSAHVSDVDDDLYCEMGGALPKSAMRPGVLLLGDVPNINHGVVLHPFITHNKGLVRSYVQFLGTMIKRVNRAEARMFEKFTGASLDLDTNDFIDGYGEGGSSKARTFFNPKPFSNETVLAHLEVCAAYQKARSARFEHGEQG